MKVVYLTAGAAGMYCGSCMHDNSVAKEAIRQGVECLLTPVYTPITTDEADQSIDRVFFGGINVFLQQKMPWLTYLPRWLDSALNRPSLIRWLTRGAMKTDARFLGALTVSMLRGMEGNQRKEVLRLCDWLTRDIQPTHLLLTNMLIAGCLPEFKQRTQARTFVTIQGDDIFLESLPEPYQQQSLTAIRSLIPWVDGFLFHSRDYADRMSRWMAIPEEKITIIPLGIELQDFRQRPSSRIEGPYRIGYLARMAPEKGLDLVVDAFIGLRKRNPECTATLKWLDGWDPSTKTFGINSNGNSMKQVWRTMDLPWQRRSAGEDLLFRSDRFVVRSHALSRA